MNNTNVDRDAAIHFTPDQAAVAIKKVTDIWHAIGIIHQEAKTPTADGLSVGLATNALKVAEFNLADLCKTLGIETDSSAERAQRFADLRAANMRIRELENQLGNSQGADVTQAALKAMTQHLNKWWDFEGFGHISSIDFGPYVCKVEFSCMMTGAFREFYSETPVSDKERKKQWHDSLRARGFDLVKDDSDYCVADTEASRSALCSLITSRLPSAKIHKLGNMSRHRVSGFILWTAEAYIHNIAEIMQLPTAQPKAEAA